MAPLYERVHTVWDFYDGILSGVADFHGSPHFFSVLRKDIDPVDTYELKPIEADLFNAIKEQWSIYRRWELQFHAGNVAVDTHPGKGGIHTRYDELDVVIDDGLKALTLPRTLATGDFRPVIDQLELPKGCMRELEVLWTPAA